MSFQM